MGRTTPRFAFSDRLCGTCRSKQTAAACTTPLSRPLAATRASDTPGRSGWHEITPIGGVHDLPAEVGLEGVVVRAGHPQVGHLGRATHGQRDDVVDLEELVVGAASYPARRIPGLRRPHHLSPDFPPLPPHPHISP